MNLSEKSKEEVKKESGQIISTTRLNGGLRRNVFRLDTTSGKSYVAKIHSSYFDDRGFSKFENEAKSTPILASRDFSPNLFYVDRNNLTIISEYIFGKSLDFEYIKNNNILPLEQAITTMTKIHTTCPLHSNLFYRNPEDLSEAIELYEEFSGHDKIINIINKYKTTIINILSNQKEHFILGDTFASNFICADSIYFVDTELCSKGPAVFDLCQLMSNLRLPSSKKKKLIEIYQNATNTDLTEAFDAATIYMDLFLIGIYSRELNIHKMNPKKAQIMNKRINDFKLDLNQLISTSDFSKYLTEVKNENH